ncbi:hypothetical protein [Ktedonospora formicarum]|uniref:Uncharacterized protein n=1 Tax=Ktedonospora formicarum TaxID=2778364 RepID=A0A8J3MQ60_9CHLR|nr:hypothetical protein [Ktedonospora formicarum]GHO44532.1 hypothetical protein KSX_26950 [Ktedonospora formicarum]
MLLRQDAVLAIEVEGAMFHPECTPNCEARTTCTPSTPFVQHAICPGCDEPIVSDELLTLIFGHDQSCDCETCLEMEELALKDIDPAVCAGCGGVFDADNCIYENYLFYCCDECYREVND